MKRYTTKLVYEAPRVITVEDALGEFYRVADVAQGRMVTPGYFASTGQSSKSDILATCDRAIAAPWCVGLHYEPMWASLEPTVRRRNFDMEKRLLDKLRTAGKFLWWDPLWKSFGTNLGVCPREFVAFKHKDSATDDGWMAPIHDDPACLDALCDLYYVAMAQLDGDPAFAYLGTPETAQGNMMPKTSRTPLVAAWSRIVETLAACRRVQPVVGFNNLIDVSTLTTLMNRARVLGIGTSAPDAIDTDATRAGVVQPLVVSCSLYTLQKVGLAGARAWWENLAHDAVAVHLEDFMDPPYDWKSLAADAAANPL